MDYQKIIVLVLLLSLTACTAYQTVIWDVQKGLRKPGEKSLALPAAVWEQSNCSEVELPFLQIETNQLIPPLLKPGNEFNHRLVYTMCSNERADEILGRLYTRIYFRGRRIVNDVTEHYAMRPGRWRVDTFITLPSDAEMGVYTLELQFISQKLKFKENSSFVVQKN